MASIIDIHPHIISTDTAKYPHAPVGGTQSTWSRERPVSYEKMVESMDAAGVAKSVIVQASTVYRNDNSYVAAAIKAFPNRFTGVFSLDMLAPDAVEKMRLWLDQGFSGMRLFTTGSTMPARGNRLARDAAAGAASLIDSCVSASSTVKAVVHTCLLGLPSTDSCSGRPRRSTTVSDWWTG